MTKKEYKSICRRAGGEDILIQMLSLIGNISEMKTESDLTEHLESGKPLFNLFDNPTRNLKFPDGTTDIENDGPYLELQKVYERVKITYGICFGGTCGEGAEYWFIKSPAGEWAIDQEESHTRWLH